MLRIRMLAFTFGVKQMICFCNKMDASIPKYSNFSFDGNNIIERSADLGWYKGSSLLDALDKANELKRRSDKAPRFPLQEFTGFVVLELFQLLFVKIGAKPGLVPTFGISSCGQYWVRH